LIVVTLWYRAPELLFGEERYGTPVDLWSVGCIFGELICKDAILPGQGELDQIDRIFSLVGVPTAESWPGFSGLPNAGLFRWKPKPSDELQFPKVFPVAAPVSGNRAFLDSNGYELLQKLLTLDPSKRLSAQGALVHPYFSHGVAPTTPRFFSSST
jgi:cell division cycle 2-like protein